MLPVIAIIGRPNVGKSTFFNYLTRSRNALVANEPGVTRDRQYGEGTYEGQAFIVIDTGGLEKETAELQTLISKQTWTAIFEADAIFWVVDARTGLTAMDQEIARKLRPLEKPFYVVINKSDGLSESEACIDFYKLGTDKIYPISAAQGRGIDTLLQVALSSFLVPEEGTPTLKKGVGERSETGGFTRRMALTPDINPPDSLRSSTPFCKVDDNSQQQKRFQEEGIKVAIVGRPNAGKSTLVNRILGEERVLTLNEPGTTRDPISIPFERRGKKYTLIDTAGVRRRRSVEVGLEKFSVVKTLQSIAESNVVVFVIDAQEGLADQDLHLLGFILDAGKSLVIAINKWDDLPEDTRESVKRGLDRRLSFVRFAQLHFISALHGSGVGDLFPSIEKAYRSATRKISTAKATEILQRAVESHQPPAVMGRRIKLRYAHVGGNNPPIIVIHGNQTEAVPDSYRRYLENFFREALSLVGTPIRIELRSGDNPYKDKKNILTERQVKRRKRLIKHVKK